MSSVKAGIISESTKLFKRTKYKVLLICIELLVIFIGIISNFTEGHINVSLSSFELNILSIFTNILIPLIVFMAVADLFAAEQENGTIKAVITRPISRYEILVSKMISILIYVICVLMITFIISSVIGVLFGRTQIINIPGIFASYIISILPSIPIIFLSILISQLSKSSTSSVMLSVLIYIIIMAFGLIFSSISSVVFTSYTNLYKFFIGAQMPLKSILTVIGLLSGYSLIFFSGAYALFEKREY